MVTIGMHGKYVCLYHGGERMPVYLTLRVLSAPRSHKIQDMLPVCKLIIPWRCLLYLFSKHSMVVSFKVRSLLRKVKPHSILIQCTPHKQTYNYIPFTPSVLMTIIGWFFVCLLLSPLPASTCVRVRLHKCTAEVSPRDPTLHGVHPYNQCIINLFSDG